jgi:hypothetical protein
VVHVAFETHLVQQERARRHRHATFSSSGNALWRFSIRSEWTSDAGSRTDRQEQRQRDRSGRASTTYEAYAFRTESTEGPALNHLFTTLQLYSTIEMHTFLLSHICRTHLRCHPDAHLFCRLFAILTVEWVPPSGSFELHTFMENAGWATLSVEGVTGHGRAVIGISRSGRPDEADRKPRDDLFTCSNMVVRLRETCILPCDAIIRSTNYHTTRATNVIQPETTLVQNMYIPLKLNLLPFCVC